jgi:6-phosphogluconolactonase (cycloisomerase 2 family)
VRRASILAVATSAAALVLCGCAGSLSTHRSHAARGRPVARLVPGQTIAGILARQFPATHAAAGCSTAVATGRNLPSARPAFVHVRGAPFGVAVTSSGRYAFVAGVGGGIGVYSLGDAGPRLVHAVALHGGEAVGVSLTPDGRYLLAADGRSGADVVDVARAEHGSPRAFLGDLSPPRSQFGAGAIEVASSADGRFAFVSDEGGGRVEVYNLGVALAHHFRTSGYVGAVPVGMAPVGLAVSPDGRWLYSTSEAGSGGSRDGVLDVIDLHRAERDPGAAVVASVDAHCSPVRVAVSGDGRVVWVTARESDQLLAFSAARLRSDPAHALLAAVRVGEAPVGLALIDGGRLVVVADSNRFNMPGAAAGLTVVSAAAALAHRAAIVGTIRSELFPREMALDRRAALLLVGNFISETLETVHVGQL